MNPGSSISVESIELFPSWEAALLPVSSFATKGDFDPGVEAFLARLSEAVIRQHALRHEVILQLWSLGPETGGNVLRKHMDAWLPEFGLGVWPDRRPPQGWTEAMLMDAAASVFTGEEPERPSYRLLRLSREKIQAEAALAMRGFGAHFEMFSRKSFQQISDDSKAVYQPAIVEPRFRREGFYLPLLSQASLRSAQTAEKLATWMCGIEFYMRESAEDRGILIVSRLPLGPLFDEVRKV